VRLRALRHLHWFKKIRVTVARGSAIIGASNTVQREMLGDVRQCFQRSQSEELSPASSDRMSIGVESISRRAWPSLFSSRFWLCSMRSASAVNTVACDVTLCCVLTSSCMKQLIYNTLRKPYLSNVVPQVYVELYQQAESAQ
jgi:hypothetical protein